MNIIEILNWTIVLHSLFLLIFFCLVVWGLQLYFPFLWTEFLISWIWEFDKSIFTQELWIVKRVYLSGRILHTSGFYTHKMFLSFLCCTALCKCDPANSSHWSEWKLKKQHYLRAPSKKLYFQIKLWKNYIVNVGIRAVWGSTNFVEQHEA